MADVRSIVCVSCHKTALVELVAFGRGKVGVCPLCGKVAYNTALVELVAFGRGKVGVCPLCGKVAYNSSDKKRKLTKT